MNIAHTPNEHTIHIHLVLSHSAILSRSQYFCMEKKNVKKLFGQFTSDLKKEKSDYTRENAQIE